MANQSNQSRSKISWGRMIGDGVKLVAAVTAAVVAGGFLYFALGEFATTFWNEQIMGRGLEEGTSAIAPNAGAWIEEQISWARNEGWDLIKVPYEATKEFFNELFTPNTTHEFAKTVQNLAQNPTAQVVAGGSAAVLGAYGVASWVDRVQKNKAQSSQNSHSQRNEMGQHEYSEIKRRLSQAMAHDRG